MSLFGPPNIEKMKAKRDVQGLIKALGYMKDSDQEKHTIIRAKAAEALGELGEVETVLDLMAALRDCSVSVRFAAVVGLGKFGPIAKGGLTAALKDSDAKVRAAAVKALGQLGDPTVVDMLITALKDIHSGVRWVASEGLGRLGDSRAAVPLVAALHDQAAYVRQEAAMQLENIGDPAVAPLIAALKDSEVRQMAADILAKMRIWDVKPFIATLQEEDGFAIQTAAQILDTCTWWKPRTVEEKAWVLAAHQDWQGCAKLGRPAVEPLIHALGYANHAARPEIAQALGELGDPRAVEPLISTLENATLLDRWPFILALGKIGTQPAVQFLVSQLATADGRIRRAALSALENIGWVPVSAEEKARYWIAKEKLSNCLTLGSAAVEPLLGLLEWGDTPLEEKALETLGSIGDARAVEPLITVLKDSDEVARFSAVKALGKIGDTRAVEPLIAALEDSDEDVRKGAAEALDKLGWQPGQDEIACVYWVAHKKWEKCVEIGACAIEPLIAVLQDRDKDVREKAAEALGEIGSPSVEPLIAALEDSDMFVCENAAKVLGKIGDARAVEPLLSHIRTSNAKSFRGVVDALCRIGDGRVIKPLIERLYDNNRNICRVSARALVNLYHQGKLSKEDRELILSQRAKISARHTDHTDSYHSETKGYFKDNCSISAERFPAVRQPGR